MHLILLHISEHKLNHIFDQEVFLLLLLLQFNLRLSLNNIHNIWSQPKCFEQLSPLQLGPFIEFPKSSIGFYGEESVRTYEYFYLLLEIVNKI
jgi:hypothetical protein